MIYKVNSTKSLKVKHKVIVVGQLIHNINYLDLTEGKEHRGLIRDNRELILEADVVEIKSFELGNLEDTEKEAVDNAFERYIPTDSVNSIKW